MNSILIRETPATPPRTLQGRILAIEPDARRAGALRGMFREYRNVDLRVVARVEDAVDSLSDRLPDLILTPTFFPPPAEAALAAHVRQMPEAAHVQILSVPYGIESPGSRSPEPRSGFFGRWRRRRGSQAPACDAAAVREVIAGYLQEAAAKRPDQDGERCARAAADVECAAGLRSGYPEAAPASSHEPAEAAADLRLRARNGEASRAERRRAPRRLAHELSLWTVRLPWGADAKVVDLSARGARLESPSKIVPGSTLDLRILGEGIDACVPARAVRVQVAGIDGRGVRYDIGAAFSRELDVVGLEHVRSVAAPGALDDPAMRALTEPGAVADRGTLVARFESELRTRLRVREVWVREAPASVGGEDESVYFTVPRRSGSSWVLQVAFEPGYAPSAAEFRLLRAAAGLAGVVLDLASPGLASPDPAEEVEWVSDHQDEHQDESQEEYQEEGSC